MNDWWIYRGDGEQKSLEGKLPEPPQWRKSSYDGPTLSLSQKVNGGEDKNERGSRYEASDEEKELVNAALLLRRPLLITGKPGAGKSSLAYAVAWELGLGQVLRWSITTKTTLQDGLYRYDALARLQDTPMQATAEAKPGDIGQYITLGPLGTALLPYKLPRVLLIDEIDKSDVDLPNDLLNIFEEAEFEIPELVRIAKPGQSNEVRVMPYDGRGDEDRVAITSGVVHSAAFPFVVMTSNGERDFPPAFLRRCLQLDITEPDAKKLARIVRRHFAPDSPELAEAQELIEYFITRRTEGELATDQLLNALYLVARSEGVADKQALVDKILRFLDK